MKYKKRIKKYIYERRCEVLKEPTGEVSMTVITIVLLVAVLGIGMFLFGSKDSVGRKWIENTFNNITNKGDNAMDNMG